MTNIHREYFDWQSIGVHAPGCRETLWEVRTLHRKRYKGGYEAGMRALCRSCSVVRELLASIGPEADPDSGDRLSGTSERTTAAAVVGYGSPAERVAGLWLHPGPPLLHGEPPGAYLLTADRRTPGAPAEVLGIVARQRGRRGGLLWTAGYGYHPPTNTTHGFKSRTAAVRWVAEQIHQNATEEAQA
ncbi:hypothetical protein ABZU32_06870 [Sphaerisporangium sp. NPDC005288]|uniref:hypothetical protein n=1 Tax=Sphaerisporangium sp. NPDC005288 TaxID=3155114 RepID=UPI0033A3BC3D